MRPWFRLVIAAGFAVCALFPLAAAPAATTITFGAVGDLGATTNTTATLNLMGTSGLSFILALGDLSYSNITPESAWCSYVQSHVGTTMPVELISGNHESNGVNGLIDNFAACLPNGLGTITGTYAKEYYLDYPATSPLARFIFISPGLTFTNGGSYDYSVGSSHYTWVSNAIDSARAAGIPWIIVSMHEVCISTGVSTCEIGSAIMNLLIQKKVDLVLQGHDHAYQRSKQLALNSSTCTSVVPESYNGRAC